MLRHFAQLAVLSASALGFNAQATTLSPSVDAVATAARSIPNTTFVTKQNFEQEVAQSKGNVLVYFGGTTWCPPCKAMKPVIAEVAAGAGKDYKMLNVDTLQGGEDAAWRKELRVRYGFAGVPTLMMLKDGRPVSIQTGLKDKATTQEWLQNALKATMPLPTAQPARPVVPAA